MAWRLISLQHCNTSSNSEPPALHSNALNIDEVPALYFLAELKALRAIPDTDLREIHKAKIAYGGVRLMQDA